MKGGIPLGEYYVELGHRIREQRLMQGLTIAQLSELINKSENFVGNIERAESTPAIQTLIDIANALNVGTDTLVQDYLNLHKTDDREFSSNPILNKIKTMSNEEQKVIWKMIDLMIRFKDT